MQCTAVFECECVIKLCSEVSYLISTKAMQVRTYCSTAQVATQHSAKHSHIRSYMQCTEDWYMVNEQNAPKACCLNMDACILTFE